MAGARPYALTMTRLTHSNHARLIIFRGAHCRTPHFTRHDFLF